MPAGQVAQVEVSPLLLMPEMCCPAGQDCDGVFPTSRVSGSVTVRVEEEDLEIAPPLLEAVLPWRRQFVNVACALLEMRIAPPC